jgi:hypothetical protein
MHLGTAQYPWVLQGTVGNTVDASGYSQYPWVLHGTVGTVTVGYCGYYRWVLQGIPCRTYTMFGP